MHNDGHALFLTGREHWCTGHAPATHYLVKTQKSLFWTISPRNPSPDDWITSHPVPTTYLFGIWRRIGQKYTKKKLKQKVEKSITYHDCLAMDESRWKGYQGPSPYLGS